MHQPIDSLRANTTLILAAQTLLPYKNYFDGLYDEKLLNNGRLSSELSRRTFVEGFFKIIEMKRAGGGPGGKADLVSNAQRSRDENVLNDPAPKVEQKSAANVIIEENEVTEGAPTTTVVTNTDKARQHQEDKVGEFLLDNNGNGDTQRQSPFQVSDNPLTQCPLEASDNGAGSNWLDNSASKQLGNKSKSKFASRLLGGKSACRSTCRSRKSRFDDDPHTPAASCWEVEANEGGQWSSSDSEEMMSDAEGPIEKEELAAFSPTENENTENHDDDFYKSVRGHAPAAANSSGNTLILPIKQISNVKISVDASSAPAVVDGKAPRATAEEEEREATEGLVQTPRETHVDQSKKEKRAKKDKPDKKKKKKKKSSSGGDKDDAEGEQGRSTSLSPTAFDPLSSTLGGEDNEAASRSTSPAPLPDTCINTVRSESPERGKVSKKEKLDKKEKSKKEKKDKKKKAVLVTEGLTINTDFTAPANTSSVVIVPPTDTRHHLTSELNPNQTNEEGSSRQRHDEATPTSTVVLIPKSEFSESGSPTTVAASAQRNTKPPRQLASTLRAAGRALGLFGKRNRMAGGVSTQQQGSFGDMAELKDLRKGDVRGRSLRGPVKLTDEKQLATAISISSFSTTLGASPHFPLGPAISATSWGTGAEEEGGAGGVDGTEENQKAAGGDGYLGEEEDDAFFESQIILQEFFFKSIDREWRAQQRRKRKEEFRQHKARIARERRLAEMDPTASGVVSDGNEANGAMSKASNMVNSVAAAFSGVFRFGKSFAGGGAKKSDEDDDRKLTKSEKLTLKREKIEDRQTFFVSLPPDEDRRREKLDVWRAKAKLERDLYADEGFEDTRRDLSRLYDALLSIKQSEILEYLKRTRSFYYECKDHRVSKDGRMSLEANVRSYTFADLILFFDWSCAGLGAAIRVTPEERLCVTNALSRAGRHKVGVIQRADFIQEFTAEVTKNLVNDVVDSLFVEYFDLLGDGLRYVSNDNANGANTANNDVQSGVSAADSCSDFVEASRRSEGVANVFDTVQTPTIIRSRALSFGPATAKTKRLEQSGAVVPSESPASAGLPPRPPVTPRGAGTCSEGSRISPSVSMTHVSGARLPTPPPPQTLAPRGGVAGTPPAFGGGKNGHQQGFGHLPKTPLLIRGFTNNNSFNINAMNASTNHRNASFLLSSPHPNHTQSTPTDTTCPASPLVAEWMPPEMICPIDFGQYLRAIDSYHAYVARNNTRPPESRQYPVGSKHRTNANSEGVEEEGLGGLGNKFVAESFEVPFSDAGGDGEGLAGTIPHQAAADAVSSRASVSTAARGARQQRKQPICTCSGIIFVSAEQIAFAAERMGRGLPSLIRSELRRCGYGIANHKAAMEEEKARHGVAGEYNKYSSMDGAMKGQGAVRPGGAKIQLGGGELVPTSALRRQRRGSASGERNLISAALKGGGAIQDDDDYEAAQPPADASNNANSASALAKATTAATASYDAPLVEFGTVPDYTQHEAEDEDPAKPSSTEHEEEGEKAASIPRRQRAKATVSFQPLPVRDTKNPTMLIPHAELRTLIGKAYLRWLPTTNAEADETIQRVKHEVKSIGLRLFPNDDMSPAVLSRLLDMLEKRPDLNTFTHSYSAMKAQKSRDFWDLGLFCAVIVCFIILAFSGRGMWAGEYDGYAVLNGFTNGRDATAFYPCHTETNYFQNGSSTTDFSCASELDGGASMTLADLPWSQTHVFSIIGSFVPNFLWPHESETAGSTLISSSLTPVGALRIRQRRVRPKPIARGVAIPLGFAKTHDPEYPYVSLSSGSSDGWNVTTTNNNSSENDQQTSTVLLRAFPHLSELPKYEAFGHHPALDGSDIVRHLAVIDRGGPLGDVGLVAQDISDTNDNITNSSMTNSSSSPVHALPAVAGSDYRSCTALESVLYTAVVGVTRSYGCGGYAIDIPFNNTREEYLAVVKEIAERNWIDQATRVVLIEYFLFHRNSGMVVIAKHLLEIHAGGGMTHSMIASPFFLPEAGDNSLATVAVFMLFVVFCTIYSLRVGYRILLTLQAATIDFIRLFVLLFEMANIGIFVFSLATYRGISTVSVAKSDPVWQVDHYPRSYEAAYATYDTAVIANCLNIVLSLLLALVYTQHMVSFSTIVRTLRRAAKPAAAIGFVALSILVGFAVCAAVSLGDRILHYHTIPDAITSLLTLIWDSWEFNVLYTSDMRLFGGVFIVFYTIFFVLFLLNALTAVFTDAFDDEGEMSFNPTGLMAIVASDYFAAIRKDWLWRSAFAWPLKIVYGFLWSMAHSLLRKKIVQNFIVLGAGVFDIGRYLSSEVTGRVTELIARSGGDSSSSSEDEEDGESGADNDAASPAKESTEGVAEDNENNKSGPSKHQKKKKKDPPKTVVRLPRITYDEYNYYTQLNLDLWLLKDVSEGNSRDDVGAISGAARILALVENLKTFVPRVSLNEIFVDPNRKCLFHYCEKELFDDERATDEEESEEENEYASSRAAASGRAYGGLASDTDGDNGNEEERKSLRGDAASNNNTDCASASEASGGRRGDGAQSLRSSRQNSIFDETTASNAPTRSAHSRGGASSLNRSVADENLLSFFEEIGISTRGDDDNDDEGGDGRNHSNSSSSNGKKKDGKQRIFTPNIDYNLVMTLFAIVPQFEFGWSALDELLEAVSARKLWWRNARATTIVADRAERKDAREGINKAIEESVRKSIALMDSSSEDDDDDDEGEEEPESQTQQGEGGGEQALVVPPPTATADTPALPVADQTPKTPLEGGDGGGSTFFSKVRNRAKSFLDASILKKDATEAAEGQKKVSLPMNTSQTPPSGREEAAEKKANEELPSPPPVQNSEPPITCIPTQPRSDSSPQVPVDLPPTIGPNSLPTSAPPPPPAAAPAPAPGSSHHSTTLYDSKGRLRHILDASDFVPRLDHLERRTFLGIVASRFLNTDSRYVAVERRIVGGGLFSEPVAVGDAAAKKTQSRRRRQILAQEEADEDCVPILNEGECVENEETTNVVAGKAPAVPPRRTTPIGHSWEWNDYLGPDDATANDDTVKLLDKKLFCQIVLSLKDPADETLAAQGKLLPPYIDPSLLWRSLEMPSDTHCLRLRDLLPLIQIEFSPQTLGFRFSLDETLAFSRRAQEISNSRRGTPAFLRKTTEEVEAELDEANNESVHSAPREASPAIVQIDEVAKESANLLRNTDLKLDATGRLTRMASSSACRAPILPRCFLTEEEFCEAWASAKGSPPARRDLSHIMNIFPRDRINWELFAHACQGEPTALNRTSFPSILSTNLSKHETYRLSYLIYLPTLAVYFIHLLLLTQGESVQISQTLRSAFRPTAPAASREEVVGWLKGHVIGGIWGLDDENDGVNGTSLNATIPLVRTVANEGANYFMGALRIMQWRVAFDSKKKCEHRYETYFGDPSRVGSLRIPEAALGDHSLPSSSWAVNPEVKAFYDRRVDRTFPNLKNFSCFSSWGGGRRAAQSFFGGDGKFVVEDVIPHFYSLPAVAQSAFFKRSMSTSAGAPLAVTQGHDDAYFPEGYFFDLPYTVGAQEANEILDDVLSSGWIDQQTRMVVVKFVTYNSNLQMMAAARFGYEVSSGGNMAVASHIDLHSVRQPTDKWQDTITILLLVFAVVYFLRNTQEMLIVLRRRRVLASWLRDGIAAVIALDGGKWCQLLVHCMVVLLILGTTSVRAYWWHSGSIPSHLTIANNGQFPDEIEYLAHTSGILRAVEGANYLVLTILCTIFVTSSIRFEVILETIAVSWKDLLAIGSLFTIVVVAFTCGVQLLWGYNLDFASNFGSAFISMFLAATTGNGLADDLFTPRRVLGNFFQFFFVIISNVILNNTVTGRISAAFKEVKEGKYQSAVTAASIERYDVFTRHDGLDLLMPENRNLLSLSWWKKVRAPTLVFNYVVRQTFIGSFLQNVVNTVGPMWRYLRKNQAFRFIFCCFFPTRSEIEKEAAEAAHREWVANKMKRRRERGKTGIGRAEKGQRRAVHMEIRKQILNKFRFSVSHYWSAMEQWWLQIDCGMPFEAAIAGTHLIALRHATPKIEQALDRGRDAYNAKRKRRKEKEALPQDVSGVSSTAAGVQRSEGMGVEVSPAVPSSPNQPAHHDSSESTDEGVTIGDPKNLAEADATAASSEGILGAISAAAIEANLKATKKKMEEVGEGIVNIGKGVGDGFVGIGRGLNKMLSDNLPFHELFAMQKSLMADRLAKRTRLSTFGVYRRLPLWEELLYDKLQDNEGHTGTFSLVRDYFLTIPALLYGKSERDMGLTILEEKHYYDQEQAAFGIESVADTGDEDDLG